MRRDRPCLIGWGARAEGKKAPIQIGDIHNLTGALGSIGAPSLAGAMLAVKQLNARGGVLNNYGDETLSHAAKVYRTAGN